MGGSMPGLGHAPPRLVTANSTPAFSEDQAATLGRSLVRMLDSRPAPQSMKQGIRSYGRSLRLKCSLAYEILLERVVRKIAIGCEV